MLPGFSSGWDDLAKRYRTDRFPAGEVSKGNTIQIGNGFFSPIYKNCTMIAATADGLFLHPLIRGMGNTSPVLIPWREITRVEPATLYWNEAARLMIGEPGLTSIVVSSDIFGKIRQHIDSDRLPAAGI